MTAQRDQLVAAIDGDDREAITRLGWEPVWRLLATAWQPKQGCTLSELRPYLELLGDADPAAVVAAIGELAGSWRPLPAEVRGVLNQQRRNASPVDAGRGCDLAGTDEALRAVAAAITAGERPCSCDHHRPIWRRDAAWVLRCRACGGLEHGQLFAAEDAGLVAVAA